MKNILLVCKKTSFELFSKKISQSFTHKIMSKEYYDKLQTSHDEHYENLQKFQDLLQKNKIKFTSVTRDEKWPKVSEFDLVVAFGGDGTVLAASHQILDSSTTLLGIKSSASSVGHLCAYNPSEIPQAVADIVSKNIKTQEYSRISAEINLLSKNTKGFTTPVLNDFLFSHEVPSLTTRYNFSLDAKAEMQKSSGIWFSTAAGSSAAIHAGGGRIIQEDLGQVQFLVREAYDLQGSNLLQGEFEPQKNICKIVNYCESAILAADGNHGVWRFEYGDFFVIKRATPLTMAL
jgi:NAD+ kinase